MQRQSPSQTKKAAKRAKKAAAAAAAAEEPVAEEEDAEAAAKAAKKAAKKAKKAAAAEEPAAEEEDTETAAKAAKKAAKKAQKAAAAAETDASPAEKEEAAPVAKEKEAPTKVEAAKAAGDDEEWKDNTYKCCDCDQDWVDEAKDQEYRYSMGFGETPKRCKDCRWAKKVRMEGGDPTAKGKGKKGKDGGDENTVFVRGLPFAATEESLTKDFSECGELVSLRMPLNEEGACKGFAFIKYASKEGMDKAMAFNETDYGGRTIYCSDAAIKPEGKGKSKGKDGKDGKGKGKDGKGKGKGKGKKGKASSEAFAKNTGAMVESTGTKVAFADSDDE
jgi:nucleolin